MIYLITKADIAEWLQLPGAAGAGLSDKQVNRAILEAQNFDIRPAIGRPLFDALVNSYGSENITIVYTGLTGGSFSQGDTISGGSGITGTVNSDNGSSVVISSPSGDWSEVTTLTKGLVTATVASITFGKYYNLMNGQQYTDRTGYLVNYEGLIPALCYFAYARIVGHSTITQTASGAREKTGGFSAVPDAKILAQNILQINSGGQSYLNEVIRYLNDKNSGTITYTLWQVVPTAKRKGGMRISSADRYERENSVRGYDRSQEIFVSPASNTGAIQVADTVYTLLNTYSYTITALNGKTLAYVQLGANMLEPNQYSLTGSTFTITDSNVPIAAGMALIISYES